MSKSTKPKAPLMPLSEQHVHRIVVRLNDSELATLDEARGKIPRSTAIRDAVFSNLPPVINIPQINQDAWLELSKVGGNLNQLVKMLNQQQGDGYLILESAMSEVKELRNKLTYIRFDNA